MASLENKTVLFIQPGLEGVGGIEKVIPVVAGTLSTQGIRVATAVFYSQVPSQQTCWAYRQTLDEQPTKSFLNRIGKVVARLLYIRKVVRESKADVVVVSAQGATIIVLLAKALRLIKVPVVAYLHEGVSVSGGVYTALMRLLYHRTSGFIAVSQGIAREFQVALCIHESRTVVAYNSLPSQAVAISHPYDTTRFSRPHFVTASRLEYIKGVDRLVKCFITYAAENLGTLFVLGTGSLERSLKELAREAGLKERIIFLGYQEQVPAFVAGCDVYLSCAPSEPFGLSILEALSVGVPAVVTDVPYGPREIVDIKAGIPLIYPHHTPYGVLFSDSDVDEAVFSSRFDEALRVVLAKDKDEVRSKARARAAYFSPQTQVGSIKKLLETVLK